MNRGFRGGRFDNRGGEGMRNEDEGFNRDFGRGRGRDGGGGRGRDGGGRGRDGGREMKDEDKTVASAEEIDERIARREALKTQQVNRTGMEVGSC